MWTKESFVARMCHACWCAYQLGTGREYNREPTADQQASTEHGVHAFLAKPDMAPQEAHESWLDHKLSTGWRHGVLKDPARKTHPRMVGFADLPHIEQRKSLVFLVGARIGLATYEKLFPEPAARDTTTNERII